MRHPAEERWPLLGRLRTPLHYAPIVAAITPDERGLLPVAWSREYVAA